MADEQAATIRRRKCNRRPVLGRKRQIDEIARIRILPNKNTSNRAEDRVLSME
jgi:hypothetical protein